MSRSAVIYCRISQDREGGGLGVERQREDCVALAERLGWQVVGIETDNDVSAYSGRVRPGYRAVVTALESGRADAVIAWHTDRLHRSNRELIDYIDMSMRLGFVTQTVKAGQIDLATATGRATAITLGAWARRESEDKSERIKSKHQQSAKLGTWRGGTRPFGYNADGVTLHPVESVMVRDAYRAIGDGETLASIMRKWNESGTLTATGKLWHYATLRQILLRERNYGASVYLGEVVKVDAWEAIVDESTWRSVRAIVSDPKRRLSTSNVGKWLLSGLARCGKCEAVGRVSVLRSGTSQMRGTRYSIYKCETGMHLARRADLSDEYVAGVIVARLQRPDARGLLTSAQGVDRPGLEREARGLRAQIEEAVRLWSEGVLTAGQLRTTSERLRQRLGSVEATMVDTSTSVALAQMVGADDVPAAWESLVWKARREVLDALMTVTVLPVPLGTPRRFSPEFIRIDWNGDK